MTSKKPKPKKKDAVREALEKELRASIPKLDTEGLAFLVEQARIHLYNMKVEELNKMREADYARSVAAGAGKTKTPKTDASKSRAVGIDKTGAGYYMRGPSGGSMFSVKEMEQMTKIVNGPGGNFERARRLYNWLVRERSDVLGSLQANGDLDGQLAALAEEILKN